MRNRMGMSNVQCVETILSNKVSMEEMAPIFIWLNHMLVYLQQFIIGGGRVIGHGNIVVGRKRWIWIIAIPLLNYNRSVHSASYSDITRWYTTEPSNEILNRKLKCRFMIVCSSSSTSPGFVFKRCAERRRPKFEKLIIGLNHFAWRKQMAQQMADMHAIVWHCRRQ